LSTWSALLLHKPNYYLEGDILAEPFSIKDGKVIIPTDPGLGVEPDLEKIEKYTVG